MFDDLFSKYSKTKKFLNKELLYSFYGQVSESVKAGQIDDGVWAKSFADAKGDEQVAKAIYLDLMVEKMILAYESTLELEKQSRKDAEQQRKAKEQERNVEERKRQWEKEVKQIEEERKRKKEAKELRRLQDQKAEEESRARWDAREARFPPTSITAVPVAIFAIFYIDENYVRIESLFPSDWDFGLIVIVTFLSSCFISGVIVGLLKQIIYSLLDK